MAELKPLPCPFCSQKIIYVEEHEEGCHTFFHCHCWSCDAFGPDETTEEQAIGAWNKRS